jgi:hypothetical protein
LISILNYNERSNDEIFFFSSRRQFGPRIGLKYFKRKHLSRKWFSFSHLLEVSKIYIKIKRNFKSLYKKLLYNKKLLKRPLIYIKRILKNLNLADMTEVVASH